MGDISFFVSKGHWSHKTFHFDWLASETLPNKRRLRDHPLPCLLLALACTHDLEHLIFCDSPDLRKGDGVLRRLVLPLLLDCC